MIRLRPPYLKRRVAADLGYAEATIGALLGHASGTVTGRYTHVLDPVLIAAADRVATTVQGYMTGESGEQKARHVMVLPYDDHSVQNC
jgi:hypothetical protein